jgi:membrane protein
MKRLLNWLLGGLAVGTAVRALSSGREPATPAQTAPTPADGPGDANLTEPSPGAAEHWYQRERVQNTQSFVKELGAEIKQDNTSLIAASLSYYAMLAIFPALIAAVSIYGLVLDPDTLADTIESFASVLPESVVDIIDDQLSDIVAAPTGGLGLSAIISILATLWAASGGTKSLIKGLNIAYDIEEHRPFLIQRVLAYGITMGLIVFVVGAVALVTGLPDWLGLEDPATRAIEILRWPGLFVLVVLGLGVLYKIAPNRPSARSRWLNVGAFVAAVLWVLATLGFSFYATSGLSNFNATYGALAGVIVLMFWLFISGFVVLLGAEVNAVLEHRRLRARRSG